MGNRDSRTRPLHLPLHGTENLTLATWAMLRGEQREKRVYIVWVQPLGGTCSWLQMIKGLFWGPGIRFVLGGPTSQRQAGKSELNRG